MSGGGEERAPEAGAAPGPAAAGPAGSGLRARAGAEAALVVAAVQFLTRLPAPDMGWSDDRLARAARHFPTAGALVGLICAAVYFLASSAFPPAVAAGLALAASMLATGGLHEDGLADCIDGLGGGRTRERAMEIMRDSRIGSYGAAAMLVSALLRWAALASLDAAAGAAALVVCHALSRAAPTAVLAACRNARSGDAAKDIAGGVTGSEALAAGTMAAALALGLLGPEAAVFALAAAIAGGFTMALWAVTRLGGYTGDVLGATEQATHVAALLALSALLGAS
ncbi:adenosylcobinamide-GDP ribazoletransferase [Rhodovulum sp. DZ06]|uniref:adenosylcobinamide-GDP ribazoletransferase n=1 Tax=Rhodovulum sp. DZ06 TaxID=3425126 RepID=UPI003D34E6A5